jgi:hypothetical protein
MANRKALEALGPGHLLMISCSPLWVLAHSRARFALAISSSLALSTWGYARSREASVSTTAAATTTRVNRLLSAGTTYHELCFVAVSRIMSS